MAGSMAPGTDQIALSRFREDGPPSSAAEGSGHRKLERGRIAVMEMQARGSGLPFPAAIDATGAEYLREEPAPLGYPSRSASSLERQTLSARHRTVRRGFHSSSSAGSAAPESSPSNASSCSSRWSRSATKAARNSPQT